MSEATAVFVLDLSIDDLGYKYTIHSRESESNLIRNDSEQEIEDR